MYIVKSVIKNILKFIDKKSIERLIQFLLNSYVSGSKLENKHKFPGIIFDTNNGRNISNYLFNLLINSSKIAQKEKIKGINYRLKDSVFFNTFPGEHYRLLNAITKIKKPKVIVEIGTFSGMSTFAFFQNFNGKFYSFDIKNYKFFKTHINKNIEKKKIYSIHC